MYRIFIRSNVLMMRQLYNKARTSWKESGATSRLFCAPVDSTRLCLSPGPIAAFIEAHIQIDVVEIFLSAQPLLLRSSFHCSLDLSHLVLLPAIMLRFGISSIRNDGLKLFSGARMQKKGALDSKMVSKVKQRLGSRLYVFEVEFSLVWECHVVWDGH